MRYIAIILTSLMFTPTIPQPAACRWVLPARVVRCESGGDLDVVNTSNPDRPAGLYQIITKTWRAYGGREFAPTADKATCREQGVVARRVLNGQGTDAWACW